MDSTCVNPLGWKYDVFISFRGADVRDGFLSHLFEALCRKQIVAFKDENLDRGEKIEPALLQTIEESFASIVIFSENYAYSSWCLDELAKIMDCKKVMGQIVLPVFYRIDPTDVQELTGSYGDAFVKHEEEFKDKVGSWSLAVKETAGMSGFVSQNLKPESKLIDEIVKHIMERLNKTFSSDSYADGLVGIKSRLEEVERLLNFKATDVRFLGIWGMGGIGKTTLAGKVFDRFSSQFQGQCFIANVREQLERCTIVELQQKILSKLSGNENLDVGMRIMSSSSIRKWMMWKKVLIVLDDVWDLDVVEFLVGNQDIYAPGSRIVITSRDKQILENIGAEIYEFKELNESEAVQLFSWHAFKQNSPANAFIEAACEAIKYAGGNPLALRVLGSNLFGKNLAVWKDQLKKLENIPDSKVEKILRISYDELDENEKEIFLDIACFFKSKDKEYVESVLESCFCRFARVGISCLLDKCLINISENRLEIHDLLQQMGKDIVRKECFNNPGKRSRLWNPQDIYLVLSKDKGTMSVESMSLDITRIRFLQLSPTTFVKMSNLRFLKFYYPYYYEDFPSRQDRIHSNIHLSKKGLNYLPDELRYLYWFNYPCKSLPLNFFPDNLVQLHLVHSHVQQLCNEDQCLENLEVLDLSYSANLITFPDLSELPNLEVLRLRGCISLVEIRSSVPYHYKLSHLDFQNCKNLCNFPEFIEFTNLGFLSLEGCLNLTEFPRVPNHLRHLNLSGTAILEVPPSMRHHSFLTELLLESCTGLESLPSSMGELKCLEKLNLKGCSELKSLPDGVCNLKSLGYFNIEECRNLNELPENLGNLQYLNKLQARGSGLKKLPFSINSLTRLLELDCSGCTNLILPPLTGLVNLQWLNLDDCGMTQISITSSSLVSLTRLYLSGNLLEKLPVSIGSLVSLKELYLRGNLLETLPTSIQQLSELEYLDLKDCMRLECLPELPSSLLSLTVADCRSLGSMLAAWQTKANMSNCIRYIDASNCMNLDLNVCRNIMDEMLVRIEYLSQLGDTSKKFQFMPGFFIPGDEVPQGMKYRNDNGSFLQCTLEPEPLEYVVLIFCAVLAPNEHGCSVLTCLQCEYNLESDSGQFFHDHSAFWKYLLEINRSSEHVIVWHSTLPISLNCTWNRASFKFRVQGGGGSSPAVMVIKCGVHVFYYNDINSPPSLIKNLFHNMYFASTKEEASAGCLQCQNHALEV